MTRPVAFVSGASRGIGAEAAVALAQAGYDLAITARTLHDGEAYDHAGTVEAFPGNLSATAALIQDSGGKALCLQADILDETGCVDAAQQAIDEFGRIDLLFNNATFQGVGNMVAIADLERAHFDATFQANLHTPLAIIRQVLPTMQAQGSGTIINMLSATAAMDPPAAPDAGGWGFAYASSKAALGRLAGCLRAEYANQGLRFLNLEPGTVITEVMRRAGLAEDILKYASPCSAAAIAAVVVQLCQDEAKPEWWSDGMLRGPAIAKALNFLDVPSYLGEPA